MLGTLNTQTLLQHIFEKYSDSLEVYAAMDFDLHDPEPCFYLYSRKDVDLPVMLEQIQSIYDLPIHIYFTHYMKHMLLDNKKLIWRKGRWYL